MGEMVVPYMLSVRTVWWYGEVHDINRNRLAFCSRLPHFFVVGCSHLSVAFGVWSSVVEASKAESEKKNDIHLTGTLFLPSCLASLKPLQGYVCCFFGLIIHSSLVELRSFDAKEKQNDLWRRRTNHCFCCSCCWLLPLGYYPIVHTHLPTPSWRLPFVSWNACRRTFLTI